MKIIDLPSGHKVKIDDDDFELVSKFSWHIQGGYAKAQVGSRKLGTRRYVSMHRLIMCSVSETRMIDHINRDKLDNRKCNLRFCDKSQNGMNRGVQTNNKIGEKNISWSKQKNRWRVVVSRKHIGFFRTLAKAKTARNNAVSILHNEFVHI